MATKNRNPSREGVRELDIGVQGERCYLGSQEALIAAGVLREEWIPDKSRGPKNGNVYTHLPDGRSVAVYRRTLGRLEVQHYPPAAERKANHKRYFAEREAAEAAARAARGGDPYRQIVNHPARYITEGGRYSRYLANELRNRYPGLVVQEAKIYPRVPRDGDPQQSITLVGTLEALRSFGLVTDAMIANAEDGRRGTQHLPIGDWFGLDEDSDAPGIWCLTIYSGAYYSTFGARSKLLNLDAARRELRRFMLPKRRGRKPTA